MSREDILVEGGMTLAQAAEQLAKIDLLREHMERGVVEFQFRKKDGSIRTAHGTLKIGASEYEFKGGARKSEKVFPYWDCDRMAWRSFSIASLI